MSTKISSLKTIGLIGKYGDPKIAPIVLGLIDFLQDRGLKVLLEQATADALAPHHAHVRPITEIGKHIDLAVVVGGDGTMLIAARNIADSKVPMIGVNLGRLGFLTDIAPDNMLVELGKVLDGDFKIEERLLLTAEVVRDGRTVHTSNAFNDVAVNKGALARLIEFESYVNDEFVNSVRADGVIVATPTGSTAYALSAGGPILQPTLPAMVLVPICPHTISDRPLAVSSDCRIEIVMTHTSNQDAHVTFDGQSNYTLRDHDRIRVRRAATQVILIHPSQRNHFAVLCAKLHWGKQF
jgi:NAD+ kinase